MMYYTTSNDLFILVDGPVTTTFSENETEGFYQAYLDWLAEGNEPEPWETE